MITEDYVSFKIAKLLKEKGFNEFCRAFRSPSGKLFYSSHDIKNFEDGKTIGGAITAPTLQMAMKWLREVHNIHIVIKSVIRLYGDTEYYYKLYGTKNKSLCVVCDIYKVESWDSNEQACEAAIKYCLENLI